MQPDTFSSYAKGYGVNVTLEESERAYKAWQTAFPEMELHLQPQPDVMHPGKYMTQTWTGFVRANAERNAILNTEFQSTSGDGASEMLWAVFRRGVRVVDFIHDEILFEIPLTSVEEVMNLVREVGRIMIESMRKVITHVEIKADPALMTRWYKEAEPVFDDSGNIMVMDSIVEGEPHYVTLESLIPNSASSN